MTDVCASFRNRIPAMILGDPDLALQETLLAHAAVCPSCAREVEAYQDTLRKLKAIPDLPVPRHFFVYGEAAARSPWVLFQQLQLRWKVTAFAAAAAMMLMTIGLVAGTRMRYESGSYTLSLGPAFKSPATSPSDIAALKAELLTALDARLQQQNAVWKAAVREEFSGLETTLSEHQKLLLQAGLVQLESRVNERILTAQVSLQGGTERSLDNLYQLLRQERRQDIATIADSINAAAARSEIKAEQTDAILSTLLDVAEQRVKN